MKNMLLILSLTWLLAGCEKTVELDYKSNQSRIIIEGNITNQTGPYGVKISKSLGLSETGNYPAVDGAVVTISDDAGNSETLLPESSGVYRTSVLSGVEGRTYTLTVMVENRTYTAQSTMPVRVAFDSIKVEEIIFTGEAEYNLIPVYRDPVTKGNIYRFVLSVNDRLISQHFVQNDEVKNGVVNTTRLEVNDGDLELKSGDLIGIKMQCIDKKAGLFYTTLALMGDSGPGGGTTPNNPPNNFSNGALGLFSAHTEEEKIVTIP